MGAEIQFILGREQQTRVLVDLQESGAIPERVTHNDTKVDNVMMDDETGEGVCVIDLDTVMPGLAVFDFGDSVRSGANPAAEDERDISRVVFDLVVFDRLAHGFLDATRDILTPVEVAHLAFGARLITFEQGIRFLTDYLNGDTYYKGWINRRSGEVELKELLGAEKIEKDDVPKFIEAQKKAVADAKARQEADAKARQEEEKAQRARSQARTDAILKESRAAANTSTRVPAKAQWQWLVAPTGIEPVSPQQ